MSSEKIRKAVQQMAGTFGANYATFTDGVVKSVDVDNRTCIVTVVNGKSEVDITARIAPVVDDGIILIPTVDSSVIVCHNVGNVAYISQFSELEKVLIYVGNSTLEIEDGEFKFNDGNLGGLIKIQDLVTKLNAIENKLNTIIAWGATVTPPLSTSPMINTQVSDLEDDKIVH